MKKIPFFIGLCFALISAPLLAQTPTEHCLFIQASSDTVTNSDTVVAMLNYPLTYNIGPDFQSGSPYQGTVNYTLEVDIPTTATFSTLAFQLGTDEGQADLLDLSFSASLGGTNSGVSCTIAGNKATFNYTSTYGQYYFRVLFEAANPAQNQTLDVHAIHLINP